MLQHITTRACPIVLLTMITLNPISLHAADAQTEGVINVPLGFGMIAGRELQVREPSMCAGKAKARIKYNKKANQVKIQAKFDGLPYRPTTCYDYNPSTPYNPYPDCVEDGKWQLWFGGHAFTKQAMYYYDATTHKLLGSEFDNLDLPDDAIGQEFPVGQAVCSPLFEANPVTLKANVTFTFDYDQILDAQGSGGFYVAFVPLILDDPATTFLHYTSPLPVSEAMHFDDVLDDLANGGFITIATSLEPDPKPAPLLAKDNLMIGWGGGVPEETLAAFGVPIDLTPYGECGTFQLPDPFPFLPESLTLSSLPPRD